MKKGFLLLVAILLFLEITMVNVPVSFAQEEAIVQDVEEVTGEVVSINLEHLSVVVKYVADEEQTETFYISDTTEIKKGDEALKLADLKAGDKVTLSYTQDNDFKKVVTVIVAE